MVTTRRSALNNNANAPVSSIIAPRAAPRAATIITNANIDDFVNKYCLGKKSKLPTDLPLNIGDWDVSRVTNMTHLFRMYPKFNEPLNNWDVRNVIGMEGMFIGCKLFNQPLHSWKVSKVKYMMSMFYECTNFDKSLNDWDVSNVTDISKMFYGCKNFDKPLNNWIVSKVTDMSYTFAKCTLFNQSLNNWDIRKVTNIQHMFENCAMFNGSLNDWNTSRIFAMDSAFYNCKRFNQPLNHWDVRNVRGMSLMFSGCTMFNQPLNNWDVRNVQNPTGTLVYMFENCPISPENKPRFFQNQVAQVDSLQIYKASAKINYEKLNALLKSAVNNVAVPANINYPTYIKNTISQLIIANGETPDKQQEQQTNLARIMNERLNSVNYSEKSILLRNSIFYSLEYVKIQPIAFKQMYVETFLKDCINAYNGEDGMSCALGAIERIVMSLIPACQAVEGENEQYNTIIAIIIANPSALIPEYIRDWYKLHKNGTPEAFPSGTTPEIKKENLRKYLLAKFPDELVLINEKIIEIADNVGYDEDDFDIRYGGKTKKRRREIKIKTMKNKNKRKTIRNGNKIIKKKTKRKTHKRK